MWKPISDYPTTDPYAAPVVLARDEWKNPVLVVRKDGHFYVCPASPLYYGDRQFGCLIADHVVEFMEIPE